MKVRTVGLIVLGCVVTFALAFTAFDQTQAQTAKTLAFNGLTPAEQDLLNEINQARANPQAYATHLENLKPLFRGKEYKLGEISLTTQEGWSAVQEAITFLRAAKPLGPLNSSKGLSLAAMWHVRDQGGSGATGHRTGNGGGFIEQRVKPFGNWQGGIGENLSYGTDNARERLLTWLIDDGFASRGHRKRIMSADYRVAGISCGPHPQFGGMCVLALAGGFTDASSTPAANKSATTPTNSNSKKPQPKKL